jgi:hypothetical protein
MKHIKLFALVALGFSLAACQKSTSDKISDCMSDPGCTQAMKQLAGPQLIPLPTIPGQPLPQMMAMGSPTGAYPYAGAAAPGTIATKIMASSTILNKAIQEKSMKVAEQLADTNNPESPNYLPPGARVERAPAAATTGAPEGMTAAVSSVGGGGSTEGEAAR